MTDPRTCPTATNSGPSHIGCGHDAAPPAPTKILEGASQWKPEPYGDRGIVQVTPVAAPPAQPVATPADLMNIITGACNILDVVKGEWAECWSEWDQPIRDSLSQILKNGYEIIGERKKNVYAKAGQVTQCGECHREMFWSTADDVWKHTYNASVECPTALPVEPSIWKFP